MEWPGCVPAAVPWHEDHIVKLHRSVISLDELGRKPIVALADTQAGAVEVSVDDRALGHISSRLDLGVYINRVRAAELPCTAQAHVTDGRASHCNY